MFFVFSKTLDLLVTPLAWAILFSLGTAVIALRWPHGRRWLVALPLLSALILLVFSLAPVANALERAVEDDAPNTFRPSETYDAVILLGGMVELYVTDPKGPPSFADATERLLATFDLLRQNRARFVIITGGAAEGDSLTEASVLGRQLIEWGISPDRIVLEEQARNTYENAVYSKRIVDAHGWKKVLIVTSAFHMRRAKECFNAVGLPVDTFPVDRRVYDSSRAPLNLLPRASNLNESSDALRELFGRVVYRVRGYAKRDP
ncbi:MAG: YdcF family protein [Myxococcaceae bacterium]|nr:YdcF family protein [Myxococcaceae bacterium]